MSNKEVYEENAAYWDKAHRRGKIMGGLLIVAAGSLFLARELGTEIPHWVFSWKVFLIGLSLVMLVKHGFRRAGWMIPLFIGSVFLLTDLYPNFVLRPVIWPIVIILFGLFIIFKPRKKYRGRHWRDRGQYADIDASCYRQATDSKEDFIDSTAVMGGVSKNILSKNFKGGDITTVFGGTEINLTQADFQGTAELHLTQVFGGTKLIIPANWHVQSDLTTIMGSLEDNRPVLSQAGAEEKKILKLDGAIICGGIEITTF